MMGGMGGSVQQAALAAGVRAGNINISSTRAETMELDDSVRAAQERHAKALMQVEARRRARTMVVPTDDKEVKEQLRSLGHPICLFGELAPDRRMRLRQLMAELEMEDEEAGASKSGKGAGESKRGSGKSETVYTTASDDLVQARIRMAEYSFTRAGKRLRDEREETVDSVIQKDHAAADLYEKVKQMGIHASQVGDPERPISSIQFSPTGTHIATSSWSCRVKVWGTEDCTEKLAYIGHTERVSEVQWHPQSGSVSTSVVNLASAGADDVVHLWGLESTAPLGTLRGHATRISRIRFHPTGNFLVSTSFDHTWRLWDIEKQRELLLQDGSAAEVYALAIHCDGSLVATGDLGGNGRLWDLRCGKALFTLSGHVKQVLSLDFAPNGFTLASGSDDHTCLIWDLRKKKRVYTIAAHSALVSQVKFAPQSGEYLATCSFDGTVNTWNTRNFGPIASLKGHEGRISGMDISVNEKRWATCSFDRTFKLWQPPA